MIINLKGSNTLVVGGSRGIGAAVVRTAAQAGSDAAWTFSGSEKGKNASEELVDSLNTCPGDLRYDAVDCTDETATRDLVNTLVSAWGSLDRLVVNAGFTSSVSFSDLTLEEGEKLISINLTSAFIASHSVIPHMKKRGGGAIVFIGSAAVVSGGQAVPLRRLGKPEDIANLAVFLLSDKAS